MLEKLLLHEPELGSARPLSGSLLAGEPVVALGLTLLAPPLYPPTMDVLVAVMPPLPVMRSALLLGELIPISQFVALTLALPDRSTAVLLAVLSATRHFGAAPMVAME